MNELIIVCNDSFGYDVQMIAEKILEDEMATFRQ